MSGADTAVTGVALRGGSTSAGVAFDGDTLGPGVCRLAYFADPDGNALMLSTTATRSREKRTGAAA